LPGQKTLIPGSIISWNAYQGYADQLNRKQLNSRLHCSTWSRSPASADGTN
jgi:hypothetical protein